MVLALSTNIEHADDSEKQAVAFVMALSTNIEHEHEDESEKRAGKALMTQLRIFAPYLGKEVLSNGASTLVFGYPMLVVACTLNFLS